MADFGIYLIAYDVKDDERRNKIARELLKYGVRVQYSVFEVFLTKKQLKNLKKELNLLVHKLEDKIVIYRQTEDEYKKVKREGNKLFYGTVFDIFI